MGNMELKRFVFEWGFTSPEKLLALLATSIQFHQELIERGKAALGRRARWASGLTCDTFFTTVLVTSLM